MRKYKFWPSNTNNQVEMPLQLKFLWSFTCYKNEKRLASEGNSTHLWRIKVLYILKLPGLLQSLFSLTYHFYSFICPGLIKGKNHCKPHASKQGFMFEHIYLQKSEGRRLLLLILFERKAQASDVNVFSFLNKSPLNSKSISLSKPPPFFFLFPSKK